MYVVVRLRGEEYTAPATTTLAALLPVEINDQIQEILRSLEEPLGDAATPAGR